MIYLTDLLSLMLIGRRPSEVMLAFLPMKTQAMNTMDPHGT